MTMPLTSSTEAPFLTIQSGPRNAWNDPNSGLRFYTWRGVDYPSVTSIRRMAGLPHGLHQWSINKVVERAIGKADEIANRLAQANFDDGIVRVIKHELRTAATAERDAAAALGTAVHDAAATGKAVDEVAVALRPRLAHYLDWLDVSGAAILASEFQVWNPSVGYAGTADLMARLRNGRVAMVDIKTGKGVWSEHLLQVIAYAKGEFVGNDGVVDERLTGYLREVSLVAVLHLTNEGWEFIVLDYDAAAWRAFRGLLLFASWLHTHSTLESVVVARRSGASDRFCRHQVDIDNDVCAKCLAEGRVK